MKYIAQINWIKPEDGGRIGCIPFNTDKYAPQIRFKGNEGNWSLVVDNYERIDNSTTLAKVYYLNSKRAPNNLFVGLDFDLYEGFKKVAFGKCIGKIK